MDEFDDLIAEVVSAAKEVQASYEWGGGVANAESDLTKATSALRAEIARVTAERDVLREEQAEECTKQIKRLWNAILRAHNILYASRTTGRGKYGGKHALAALDAENILYDAMNGGGE